MAGHAPSDAMVKTVERTLIETASTFEPVLAKAFLQNFSDPSNKVGFDYEQGGLLLGGGGGGGHVAFTHILISAMEPEDRALETICLRMQHAVAVIVFLGRGGVPPCFFYIEG